MAKNIIFVEGDDELNFAINSTIKNLKLKVKNFKIYADDELSQMSEDEGWEIFDLVDKKIENATYQEVELSDDVYGYDFISLIEYSADVNTIAIKFCVGGKMYIKF